MRFKRKMLSIIMTAAMITTLFAGMTITASADNNPTVEWDSTTADTSWYNTTDTLFALTDAADLAGLAILVNGGNDFSGKTINLSADVDTTAYIWPAIGCQSHPFAGTFNGQGHSVKIYVYAPNDSTVTHKGIFGSTTSAATVKNVASKGVVGAYRYAGGIVGYNAGVIEYCYNEASITGNDSGSRGSGGIAGVNIGTIRNCYNKGTVYNLFRPAGGITGIADSTSSNIQNCYNVGSVSSSSGTGWAGAIMATLNGSTVSNCYYLSTSAAHAVAYPSSTTGSMSDANMKAASFVTTLNNNAGSTVWKAVSGDYPTLSVFTAPSSSYTITLTSGPTTTVYNAGQTFNSSGIVITATDSGGGSATVTNYVISKTTPLYVTDTSIIVSGDFGGTPYSFSVPITVNATMTGSVYLNGTATTNGNGTSANPFNNLTDAVNQAVYNNLGVTMTGTVTISGPETLHPPVTFTRGSGFSDPMFEIAAGTGNEVIFTSATMNGNGSGTIFDVSSGKLTLRGGITLTNCAKAVNVQNTATVEVNKAAISTVSGGYSIYKNTGGSFIFNDYGGTTIDGTVYLAHTALNNGFFNLSTAIPSTINTAGKLKIECSPEEVDTIIAFGSSTNIAASVNRMIYDGSSSYKIDSVPYYNSYIRLIAA